MIYKIWKYPLDIKDEQTIRVPYGSRPLTVQLQNNMPMLWVLCAFESVTSDSDEEDVVIATYGTGNNIMEAPGEYIGTYQLYGGTWVWHVFYKVEK